MPFQLFSYNTNFGNNLQSGIESLGEGVSKGAELADKYQGDYKALLQLSKTHPEITSGLGFDPSHTSPHQASMMLQGAQQSIQMQAQAQDMAYKQAEAQKAQAQAGYFQDYGKQRSDQANAVRVSDLTALHDRGQVGDDYYNAEMKKIGYDTSTAANKLNPAGLTPLGQKQAALQAAATQKLQGLGEAIRTIAADPNQLNKYELDRKNLSSIKQQLLDVQNQLGSKTSAIQDAQDALAKMPAMAQSTNPLIKGTYDNQKNILMGLQADAAKLRQKGSQLMQQGQQLQSQYIDPALLAASADLLKKADMSYLDLANSINQQKAAEKITINKTGASEQYAPLLVPQLQPINFQAFQ